MLAGEAAASSPSRPFLTGAAWLPTKLLLQAAESAFPALIGEPACPNWSCCCSCPPVLIWPSRAARQWPDVQGGWRQGLTLLCSLLEWPLDKLKFVRLSSPKIRGRFHNSAALLSALMFLCAIAGLLHYPTGPLWCRPPPQPRRGPQRAGTQARDAKSAREHSMLLLSILFQAPPAQLQGQLSCCTMPAAASRTCCIFLAQKVPSSGFHENRGVQTPDPRRFFPPMGPVLCWPCDTFAQTQAQSHALPSPRSPLV